uniref:Putative membrane protein n=1 Tax=Rhipicephalus microplus TaxID=6941 RepID=A0A6G5AH81_RHIMP
MFQSTNIDIRLNSKAHCLRACRCLFLAYHQPDYTYCRTKASPMIGQSTWSCAFCCHVIRTKFLISLAHLTFCFTSCVSFSVKPLMTSGYSACVLCAQPMFVSPS